MKKLKLLFFLQIFCLLAAVTVNAQVKNNVVKIYAYIQETIAGNIQVDENRNPINSGVDHVHYIYAETTGKLLPQWNTIYTHYGVFAIQAELIDSAKITVGQIKNSSKTATIMHKRGNRLWKLNLIPIKAATPTNISALLTKNDAVMLTQFGSKHFVHTIAKEIQLEPLFYP
jgi:hypothetical protein